LQIQKATDRNAADEMNQAVCVWTEADWRTSKLRVGNFYLYVVLTMVKTQVKTRFGKTPKTHISWVFIYLSIFILFMDM